MSLIHVKIAVNIRNAEKRTGISNVVIYDEAAQRWLYFGDRIRRPSVCARMTGREIWPQSWFFVTSQIAPDSTFTSKVPEPNTAFNVKTY